MIEIFFGFVNQTDIWAILTAIGTVGAVLVALFWGTTKKWLTTNIFAKPDIEFYVDDRNCVHRCRREFYVRARLKNIGKCNLTNVKVKSVYISNNNKAIYPQDISYFLWSATSSKILIDLAKQEPHFLDLLVLQNHGIEEIHFNPMLLATPLEFERNTKAKDFEIILLAMIFADQLKNPKKIAIKITTKNKKQPNEPSDILIEKCEWDENRIVQYWGFKSDLNE
jgi:hypothetical protein